MEVFCTQEFRDEVAQLRKNNSYADIEAVIAEMYCDATFAEANTGDPLAIMPGMNFLKKRAEGRGGYRFYIFAVVKGERVYLGYVHPKTGRYGQDNVSPEMKKLISRQIREAIIGQQLICVKRDETQANRIAWTAYESADRELT